MATRRTFRASSPMTRAITLTLSQRPAPGKGSTLTLTQRGLALSLCVLLDPWASSSNCPFYHLSPLKEQVLEAWDSDKLQCCAPNFCHGIWNRAASM